MSKLSNKFIYQIVFVTGILLVFAACGRPKGVLSENEMVNVLTDLHKLDGSLAAKGISYNDIDKKNEYYNAVLKKKQGY